MTSPLDVGRSRATRCVDAGLRRSSAGLGAVTRAARRDAGPYDGPFVSSEVARRDSTRGLHPRGGIPGDVAESAVVEADLQALAVGVKRRKPTVRSSNNGCPFGRQLAVSHSVTSPSGPIVAAISPSGLTSTSESMPLVTRRRGATDARVLPSSTWNQPLVVPNEQGSRPVDVQIARALMRDYAVGAHAANRANPCFGDEAGIWRLLGALEARGYVHEPEALGRDRPGRYFFECYPNLAIIGWLGCLPRSIAGRS